MGQSLGSQPQLLYIESDYIDVALQLQPELPLTVVSLLRWSCDFSSDSLKPNIYNISTR